MSYKVCRKCGVQKPLILFAVRHKMPDLHDDICKVCRINKANPLKIERKKERDWLKQFSPV